MRKKRIEIDEYDVTIYEPVNSRYRENMYMKRSKEERTHDYCGPNCRGRSRKKSTSKRQTMLQFLQY